MDDGLLDIAARADTVARILEDTVAPLTEPLRGQAPATRFVCLPFADDTLLMDYHRQISSLIPNALLWNAHLNWSLYYTRALQRSSRPAPFSTDDLEGELVALFRPPVALADQRGSVMQDGLELCAATLTSDAGPLAALQRNAAAPRDIKRLIPEPIVVIVTINGQRARALLDSGSLSDFMSAKFAHQLNIKAFELIKPLPVHLAVQGSRAKINCGCRAVLEYQRIRTDRYFDIVNLLNYDLILGTPFLYQHRISLTFNPMAIVIGSDRALPVEGKQVRVLESRAADIRSDQLDTVRNELRKYAAPICKEASDSPLPPLRAINHRIPLKDESKIYSWRPSKCPDAHRASWIEKRDAYLKS
ncbi:hypothetical protein PYCCODRAFT_1413464, partial [Trametes coccinea BRFM310]